ncbi:MAG: type II CAAX prenyl endopeptidase Rce1 family protein [Candidatus Brocadiia bacterium]
MSLHDPATGPPNDALQPPPPDEEPAEASRPAPSRTPWLHHPLLYALLLGFLLADSQWGFLPSPSRTLGAQAAPGAAGPSLEEMIDDPLLGAGQEVATVGLVALALLVLGGALDLGYLVLRAHNIRVFPRVNFRGARWEGWHLLRFVVVFLVVMRLAGAGVAGMEQVRKAGYLGAVSPALVAVVATNVAALALCGFLVALVAAGGLEPLGALGLRERKPWSRGLIGVVAFVMIVPVSFLARLATELLGPMFGVQREVQPIVEAARAASPASFAAMVFGGVVVAAVTEEILFRGFIYATVRRYMGPLQAIVLTAALFAWQHQYAFGFLVLFVLGFLLCYLYERTGSLVAPIAAHAANNLYTFLMLWVMR